MNVPSNSGPQPLLLGIEGGGTHTIAILASADGHLVQRIEAGPANFRLLDDPSLEKLLQGIAACCARPAAIGLGMAGVREDADRARLRRIALRVWPGIPMVVGNDLETALAASPASDSNPFAARVVVISGTGSCVFGRRPDGLAIKVGGWGHHLGDRGSGYDIGLRAVRLCIQTSDRLGKWPALGARLLRRLLLNEPDALIPWAQSAAKADVASLAIEVFAAAAGGDPLARSILSKAGRTLAEDAVTCARRLTGRRGRVEFVLAGSILVKQPTFARSVARAIGKARPGSRVQTLFREGAWGAFELARFALSQAPALPVIDPGAVRVSRLTPHPSLLLPSLPAVTPGAVRARRTVNSHRTSHPGSAADTLHPKPLVEWKSAESSPTEQRNPRSLKFDQLSIDQAIALMVDEDRGIPDAVQRQAPSIAQAIRLIVAAFRKGGRLFYAGAGTSGRLGVLDASECLPTFRVHPDQVQGIIAGGHEALWRAVEGAEDDHTSGERAVIHRGVRAGDVLVGIAASGRTPFVWGALAAARRRAAKTVLLCFNPHLEIPRTLRPNVVVAIDVGPEVLTGSTRLKSGTATKIVLNMLTTIAMVRTGKVLSNLMIDLNPSNAKLRDRAVRIVCDLAQIAPAAARQHLEASGWHVKTALKMAGFRKGVSQW